VLPPRFSRRQRAKTLESCQSKRNKKVFLRPHL